jgi:hypothetical protein
MKTEADSLNSTQKSCKPNPKGRAKKENMEVFRNIIINKTSLTFFGRDKGGTFKSPSFGGVGEAGWMF